MASTVAVLVLALCLAALSFLLGLHVARHADAVTSCEVAARGDDVKAVAILLAAVAVIFILAVAGWPS
mgnify:CR=1 FL=1